MRFELSSKQFASDEEFEVESIKDLLVEAGLKELFEQFIALSLIHLGG